MADNINAPLHAQGLPSVDYVNKTEPSVDMLEISSNKLVKIPLSQIQQASSSGAFAFKNDQRLPVVDNLGEVGNIPASQLNDALGQGFQLQSPEDYIKYSADKIAGDQIVKTFGENVGSALTFGLSTAAQVKSGTDPQAIAARDIANPVAGGLGTATGIIAPLILTGGGSAIAEGTLLAGTGVRAAAKAGLATEKYLAKEATKLGIKNAVARSIVQKIAPKIAGSAIEAIPFAAGQYIDETALGAVDNTAENFLATIGTGALIGGSIGGVLGTLQATVPSVSKAFRPIKDKLGSYVNEEKSAMEYLGTTVSKAQKLEDTRPGFFKDSVKDLREMGLKLTDNTEDALGKVASEKESIGKRIEEIYDMSPTTKADEVYSRLSAKVSERAEGLKIKGTIDPVYRGEFDKLTKLADDYKGAAFTAERESTNLASKDIKQIRQRLDEEINFYKRQPDRPAMQQTMYDLRTELRDILVEGAEKAKPELGAELKQLGKKFGRFHEYFDMLDNKLLKERGLTFSDILTGGLPFAAVPGSPSVAFGIASLAKFANSDLRRKMIILGKLEAANLAVTKAVDGAVKSVFSPIKSIAVPLTTTLINYDLARSSEGRKPKDKVQAFQNIRDNLIEASTNSERALEVANRRTMPIYNYAPNTSGFIETKAASGVNFLASKLPKRGSQAGAFTILKDNYIPSTMEMAKFERYVKAVENPLQALKEIDRGALTREHVEALKSVYPSIYKSLQMKVIDEIQKHPEKLTYNKKIQMGILLDIPTDSSLLPQNVLGLQAQFQTQPSSSGIEGAKPVVAARDMSFDSRAQNATENVLNSED